MSYNDVSWLENGFHQSFFEEKMIENIHVTGKGVLDIYFSPGQNILLDGTSEKPCVKIASFDTYMFPIGFTDVLQHHKTYDFTYVFKGDNESPCETMEIFHQFEPLIKDPEAGVQFTQQCLLFAQSLHLSLLELIEFNQEAEQFIRCASAFYWYLKESFSIDRTPQVKLLANGIKYYQELKNKSLLLTEFPLDQFDACLNYFSETPEQKWYDLHAGKYINALMSMDEKLRACFLKDNFHLIEYHCIESAKTITQYKKYFKNEIMLSRQLLNLIFCNSDNGVITEILRIYSDILNAGSNQVLVLDFINNIVEHFNNMVTAFEEKYEFGSGINLSNLNVLIDNIKPEGFISSQETTSDNDCVPYELIGSINKILDFSCIESEKKLFFRNFIENFKECGPKIEQISIDSRRRITTIFFELYESVLIRYIKEDTNDKALDMFLTYGFVDSDLLLPQQVYDLYCLLDQYSLLGSVYSIKSWLTQVALKNKLPSVNELGITFEQLLKEKSYGRATSEQNTDSGEHRLHHEIVNLFRTCHRVLSGQSSTYFPILCSDMLPTDIRRVIVTPAKIRDALQKVLDKDYSAFHREVFYSGNNEAFKKELIMKQILPDIILMPVMGSRAMMWQEISGASKSSPGRFILPMLTSDNLEFLTIKLVGQFRWELCRSIMGVRWNNISYKTLTSVYTDYIENYKKNKNLTVEMKERVRSQIRRHRNNLRNIFTSDYEAWMRYECQGMRKLNKEARTILYQFCPFPRRLRNALSKNPAFTEIAASFDFEREKTVREIENRYTNHVKQGHALDNELEDNIKLFKQM